MKSIARYAFIIANLRAKISYILDPDFFYRCAELKDLDSLLAQFKGTEFEFLQEVYHRTGDIKSCEKKLRENELYYNSYLYKKTTRDIQAFCRSLAVEYEVDLLKELLRMWFSRAVRHENISALTPYLNREVILHPLPVDPIVNAPDFVSIAHLLSGTPYSKVLLHASEAVEAADSVYPAELQLDAFSYQTMLEGARGLHTDDRSIAMDYVATLIDLENLNRMVRLEAYYHFNRRQIVAQLLPGGKRLSLKSPLLAEGDSIDINLIFQKVFSAFLKHSEKSTTPLEKLQQVRDIEQKALELQAQRALVGDPFSIGVIIAFIIRKKIEIQRAMTLINAKYYRLPAERVRELL